MKLVFKVLEKITLVKVPSPQSDMANNNLKNRRFSTPSGAFTAITSETKCETRKKTETLFFRPQN